MASKYNAQNVKVGDRILSTFDEDDDEYGVVTEVLPKSVHADWDGDIFRITYAQIVDLVSLDQDDDEPVAVVPPKKKSATKNIGQPAPDADDDGMDDTDVMDRPKHAEHTLPAGVHALAAADQTVTVKPGTIVTVDGSGRGQLRGMHKDRMYVVLAWTKNSARASVNVAPVNGVQPGEKFSYDYMRVNVASCTPILFGYYVKVPANQKGSK
jgi:hypothetical protein